MSKDLPEIKLRSDYKAPDFLIEHVQLEFHLDAQDTKVICISKVKRVGDHQRSLVLDGEQLRLQSVHINEQIHQNYSLSESSLSLVCPLPEFELRIETTCKPQENKSLEGLYLSAGAFCTQCEAEGFRKITYFLDRPDVLATYDVTIYAQQAHFPYLLSNGNKMDSGTLGDGRHWVKWQDPHKKPCYLFALVAGDFDLLEDEFVTASGRKVALELFVDKGKLNRGDHALASLKKSMTWDEETFGLEYDLDIYMIVAVDFFNMGAMENKGLNVFNSKFVLADPTSATDEDYFNIEAVIAHEYFHNWTGNRVTCRDWFQLSLKEGLTVFRDQQFSADMSSAVVNRIKNVRTVREQQFAEDASAMAHPIRPDSVIEMNNFYTVTVYDKGAEVIRMIHTLLGVDGFRKGMDLYFERHDGQAVTCDDFVQAMEDANHRDLSQFKLWYSQSGTPQVKVREDYDPANKRYTLHLSQLTPNTADQSIKQALHIPIKYELVSEGKLKSGLIELKSAKESIVFEGFDSCPVPALLLDFSAPIKLDYAYDDAQLRTIMKDCSDDFARWDASQSLFSRCILGLSHGDEVQSEALISSLLKVIKHTLADTSIDKALLAEMLTIPSFETLCQQVDSIDVDAIYYAREKVQSAIAREFLTYWQQSYESVENQEYQYVQEQVDNRRLRNLCLFYLTHAVNEQGGNQAQKQFEQADNMADSLAALKAAQAGSLVVFEKLMQRFEEKWRHDPLVLDKWFALHANTKRADILSHLDMLMAHSQFTINNPNRVRAVVGSFTFYNPIGFHAVDGSGYKFVADYLIKLDKLNPQVASRIVTPLTQWRKFDPQRQELMRYQLARISDSKELSKDLFEKVSKSLQYTD